MSDDYRPPSRQISFRQRLSNRVFGGDTGAVFRGMATLAMGSGVAKLVGLAVIPILTRLYTPEDFGVMAVFTAMVVMITPILTLRYGIAIPLPRHDGAAMNLMALSMLLLIGWTIVMTVGLLFFSESLLGLVEMEVLIPWWWLIVLGCVGTGVYELLSFWATRQRNYKVIARTNVTQQLAGSIVKLGLGALSFGSLGLLIGHVVSKGGGALDMTRTFAGEIKANWAYVRWSRILAMAGYYKSFPVYRVPSQFLLVFSQQSPVIAIVYLYGTEVGGQFSLAMTALALPVGLVGAAMGNALFAEASHLGLANAAKIYSIAKKTQLRLLIIAIPPAAILFGFGDAIFSIVFGDTWEQAGRFASILAILILFQFTSAPLIQLLNIFKNQIDFLIINLARSAAIVIMFLVFQAFGFQENDFVLVYGLIMTAFYIFVSVIVLSKIKSAVEK